jgi:tripartite-type tricarboxylate transporter receptor subunit TctC
MHPFNRRALLRTSMWAGLGLASNTFAQPEGQTMKIIVGYSPGNSVDMIARLLADKMSASLHRPIIVENKVGAGSRIAVQALKNAPPDGNTLMLSTFSVMGVFPMIFSKSNYQLSDFQPVAHVADSNIVLAAPATAPYRTLAEYASWVKAHPEKAQFGNEAPGSPAHLLGIEFGRTIGVNETLVPYQSTGQLISDLIGNQIPLAALALPSVLEMHRAGKLRILAIASEKRTPNAPDLPTVKESGYNLALNSWYGAWMPGKTPIATVDRVSKALVDAIHQPDVQAKLRQIGLDPTGEGRAEFVRISEQSEKLWAQVVKNSGFRLE